MYIYICKYIYIYIHIYSLGNCSESHRFNKKHHHITWNRKSENSPLDYDFCCVCDSSDNRTSLGNPCSWTLIRENHRTQWCWWSLWSFPSMFDCQRILIIVPFSQDIPSAKLTYLWEIINFTGKNRYKWPFSVANC